MTTKKAQNKHKHSIFYLGPEGSFSHEAAKMAQERLPTLLPESQSIKLTSDDFDPQPCNGHEEIETCLKGEENVFAVVPISNNKEGDVYDYLPFCSYERVTDLVVPVSFCLCSHSKLSEIKRVATKAFAYQQVYEKLKKLLPANVDNSLVTEEISTSKAAQMAAEERDVAAICSQTAAELYDVPIQVEKLEGKKPFETTFGVFRNAESHFSPPANIAMGFNHFIRGAHVYAGEHPLAGKEALANMLAEERSLVLKWGVDPIHPSLHLGHLSNLLKLRDFAAANHKVHVVIGTFTGLIGDPSGNLSRRGHVKPEVLQSHGEGIASQISKVLGEENIELVWNHELMEHFDLKNFLQWMRHTDVRYMEKRPDFRNRMKGGFGLSVAEFAYPLFQALDTAHIRPDIEVGGVDQIWNCLLAKDIMKSEGVKIPLVLLLDEVKGTDGSAKMSSFKGNAIHLAESQKSIRKKVLQLSDELLPEYFVSLTREPLEDVYGLRESIKDQNFDARPWKEKLAEIILEAIN